MSIWSWLIGAFGGFCCKHDEWERLTVGGNIYRSCVDCNRVEKLNPHSGEWSLVSDI